METNADISIIHRCAKALIKAKITIAFAESATCGRIASEFALAPDAGKFLEGGIACYDTHLKERLLNVHPKLIKKYTPESQEVTQAITIGLENLFDADILIGCTGLTVPGGSETEEKPVGTIFLHGIHNGRDIFSARYEFSGNQLQIINQVINRTAELLLGYLKNLTK